MNFLQLKYITTIMDEGGISAAARKLYISQPSLSQMLHTVEAELGVELLDRSAAKIVPTYAGELFYQQAKVILMNYNSLMHTMKEIAGQERSRLKIGIPVSRGTYILPRLLQALQEDFPLVKIETFEGQVVQLEEQLCRGEIDLVFSHYFQRKPELCYHPIATEEWLLAIPKNHPLAALAETTPDWRKRPSLQLDQLRTDPFILLRKGHTSRKITDDIFEQAGFFPQIALETHSIAVAHSIALSGLGVTVLPENEVRFHSLHVEGAYFCIDQHQFKRQLCLCYHKELHLTPRLKTIISRIIDVVSSIYRESDQELSVR